MSKKMNYPPTPDPSDWKKEFSDTAFNGEKQTPLFTINQLHDYARPLIEQMDDLIVSLRDMIDWLDDGNRMLSDNCQADVAKAIAAIAKATGEKPE